MLKIPSFRWFRPLLFAALLVDGGFSAQAKDVKWTHYGLRPLGMGNAYVAVADDFNALFYNPAGLARLKEWDGELINPYVELSKVTKDFIQDAQDLGSGSGGDNEAIINLMEEQSGNVQHLAVGMTPHLIFKHFGIGIGLELSSTMVFHRYPSIELDVGPRLIVPISLAFNFLEDRLSLGFSVKGVMRGGIDREFSIQDIDALSGKKDEEEVQSDKEKTESEKDAVELKDFVEGGYGYGADVGLLFTPIKTMAPTLGVSISDLGGTPYKLMNVSGEALGTPDVRLPSVNFGYSMRPFETQRTYLLTAVDIHSANQPFSFSKKLNLGAEFGLGSILKLQAGLHQGYMSGGVQLDVGILSLRFVSYAEEMGEVAGSIEDRRYAVQLKLLI